MKKTIAFLLTIVLVLSFAACGKSNKSDTTSVTGAFKFASKDAVSLGVPEKTVNPEEVYAKLEYTPEMFYGRYSIDNPSENTYDNASMRLFKESAEIVDDPFEEDERYTMSTLPYRFDAGPNNIINSLVYETKYHWMTATFVGEGADAVTHDYAYEVEGNKLILTGVDWSYDSDNKKLEYTLLENTKMEYAFSFKGRSLTLTAGDKSVTLRSGLDAKAAENFINCSNYCKDGTKRIDTIEQISFLNNGKDSSFDVTYIETKDGIEKEAFIHNGVAELNENGVFTFTLPYEDGEKTYQFVCFLCGDDGIVLADGENTYYYTDSYSQHTRGALSKNVAVEQVDAMQEMSESQLKEIQEKTTDLFDDLASAFSAAGIAVTVNKETGELAMDTSVLFGGDSADVTDEGKDFLNKFIKAYTDIIYNEKYDGFIAKTVVEGHAAPVEGVTYEEALPFSQKRAQNVLDYCLSGESGVDTAKLAATMEAVGYSNSMPIYDDDGNIDFDASRRVSFRFIINVE